MVEEKFGDDLTSKSFEGEIEREQDKFDELIGRTKKRTN